MTLGIRISSLNYLVNWVIWALRNKTGHAVFVAGLALMQVVGTCFVIASFGVKLFAELESVFALFGGKVAIASQTKLYTSLAFGFVSALFVELLMFHLVINKMNFHATVIACITGGLSFFTKFDAAVIITVSNFVAAMISFIPVYGIAVISHRIAEEFELDAQNQVNLPQNVSEEAQQAYAAKEMKEITKIR